MTGRGVTGRVEGRAVAIGNVPYLESLRVDVAELARRAEPRYREGQTVVFAAIDGKPAGLLAVTDPIKPAAREAVQVLRNEGISVVMVTGDRRATADAVARAVGIDRVDAEVLPAQKADVVARLQREGQRVAMAGDGINDAPALAKADVGIAMGTGTDVAMESAAITLVKGDLRGIVRARRLSLRDDEEHPAEPVLRVCLQRAWRAGGRGCAVSGVRGAPESDDRERGNDVQLGVGHRQRASLAPGRAVTRRLS